MSFLQQSLAIDLGTAHPAEALISYREVAECIDKTISKIENEILKVLQKTPPELYSNLVHNGIWLAGGGSLLRGIARGTCLALKKPKNIHS